MDLYAILDVFSRYVVGWMLAPRESAELAKKLIEETCEKPNIQPDTLGLHADRGSAIRPKPVALLLADLSVTKTHSRPYTSNDNPYSESQFRTMQYRPEFPDRFGCLEDGRAYCHTFFPWYNDEHHHSGIGMMTPAMVHYGLAAEVRENRQLALDAAYVAHPERFVRRPPARPSPSSQGGLDQQTANLRRKYSLNIFLECLKVVDTYLPGRCHQPLVASAGPSPVLTRQTAGFLCTTNQFPAPLL